MVKMEGFQVPINPNMMMPLPPQSHFSSPEHDMKPIQGQRLLQGQEQLYCQGQGQGQGTAQVDTKRLNSVDSESGYSSTGNDTPSSSKSHSPAGSHGAGTSPAGSHVVGTSPAGSHGPGNCQAATNGGQKGIVQVKVEQEDDEFARMEGLNSYRPHNANGNTNTMLRDDALSVDKTQFLQQQLMNKQTSNGQSDHHYMDNRVNHIANLSSMSLNLSNNMGNPMNGMNCHVPPMSEDQRPAALQQYHHTGAQYPHNSHMVSPPAHTNQPHQQQQPNMMSTNTPGPLTHNMSPHTNSPHIQDVMSPGVPNQQSPHVPAAQYQQSPGALPPMSSMPAGFDISLMIPSAENIELMRDYTPPVNPTDDVWAPMYTVPCLVANKLIDLLPKAPTADKLFKQLKPEMLLNVMGMMKPEVMMDMMSNIDPNMMATMMTQMPPQIIHAIMSNMKPDLMASMMSKMTPQAMAQVIPHMTPDIMGNMASMMNSVSDKSDQFDGKDGNESDTSSVKSLSPSIPSPGSPARVMLLGFPLEPCLEEVDAMLSLARQPVVAERVELVETVMDTIINGHLESCLFVSKRLHKSLMEFMDRESKIETVSVLLRSEHGQSYSSYEVTD